MVPEGKQNLDGLNKQSLRSMCVLLHTLLQVNQRAWHGGAPSQGRIRHGGSKLWSEVWAREVHDHGAGNGTVMVTLAASVFPRVSRGYKLLHRAYKYG